MGLAERKAVASIKDTEFKNFEAQIKQIIGVELSIEFDWAVLEAHKDCVWIGERKKCSEYMFDRIIEVFLKVCADQMGKDAVKESVKGLKLIPSAGDVNFSKGILTVRNDVAGNGAYSANQIREVLEKDL
jgi:hypothetical protein